jgi:alpha-galactosidase
VLLGNDAPLLHLGNPAALAWVKNHFSTMIEDIGIDCYRQDFNLSPLSSWRNNDAADRQGMNEITHIMGLYEYWDYLLSQHPNLLIDNCASGGRRIDIETLKRSYVLWRSDTWWFPDPEQCINYGLSFWLPFTGRGSLFAVPYDFRSGMGYHLTAAVNFNDPGSFALWKAALDELDSIRYLFRGDYYPLTGYTQDTNVWIAWQYNCPDIGEGLVQAFRRVDNTESNRTFKLKNLDSSARYNVMNLDIATTVNVTGESLMTTGLEIWLPSRGSAMITYKKN